MLTLALGDYKIIQIRDDIYLSVMTRHRHHLSVIIIDCVVTIFLSIPFPGSLLYLLRLVVH